MGLNRFASWRGFGVCLACVGRKRGRERGKAMIGQSP